MSTVIEYTWRGVTKRQKVWAEELGISIPTLRYRVATWGVQLALSTPKNIRPILGKADNADPGDALWEIYHMSDMLVGVVELFKDMPRLVMRGGDCYVPSEAKPAPVPRKFKEKKPPRDPDAPAHHGRILGSFNKKTHEKEAEVLEMYRSGSYSQREIAHLLNANVRTVRTIIENARNLGEVK